MLQYDRGKCAILEEGEENAPMIATPVSHLNELVKGK